VISDREWVDYMTGKTDMAPTQKEEVSVFDVDDKDLMSILFGCLQTREERDPKRIRNFCNQLADIWESECPDWRFGQLITNVITRDPFYIEDDEMMECFRRHFHLDEKRGNENGSSKHQ